MIDLTRKSLPSTVCVGGRDFFIHTDYRIWLRFEREVKEMDPNGSIDLRYLFVDDCPYTFNVCELFPFSRPASVLPRKINTNADVIALDYDIDSDLIYAAFLGQYGIDLIDVEDLHWHKFLALLQGINGTTKLREVIGYRCYDKNIKSEKVHEDLKRAWTIDPPISREEQAELDSFNQMFGG